MLNESKLYTISIRGRHKRSLIIGFGSKRSYHRNQNDHDQDLKIGSPLVQYDPEKKNIDQIKKNRILVQEKI